MKTFYSCIVCIVCIACIVCISQIGLGQVQDDFSDGNFTNNPEWTGDTGHFEINATDQLQLKSAGSDTAVIFTRNTRVKDTEWRFWMKLSFNTSLNNHARIYLAADTSLVFDNSNALFVQVGGADDSIIIVKQTGMNISILHRFKTYKTLHSTNTMRYKITCDGSGHWETMIDTTGGYNYISDGAFFDDSFLSARWFGLMCRYTSSNATKFYFDDFYIGPILFDTVPPGIIAAEAVSEKIFRVTFSEAVQKESAEKPENYHLISHNIFPDSVSRDSHSPELVTIYLHDPLEDGTIESLQIRNILDMAGNHISDTVVQVCFYQPKVYDILIHEIMADPDPPVGLPNGEFVELYNRSAFPVSLKNWTFKYGSNSKVFPATTIQSWGYLLIVKDSAFLYLTEGIALFTSSSSLSNEGTTLVLSDSRQHVIHSVSYNPDWYQGLFKEEGGWSLEMIDPSNPCGCMENWEPSKDAFGGTPGKDNSISAINPDQDEPVALRAFISDSSLLEVTFSEAMDSVSVTSPSSWTIYHPDGVAHPDNVTPVPPFFNTAKLTFRNPFKGNTEYRIKVTGTMNDCAGNECDTLRSIRFAIPDPVSAHDVIINEILSNPVSGGSRFVELYNRSEKTIDLQTLVIANRDTVLGILANAMPVTEGGYLLFPGDYIAITTSPDNIIEKYSPAFPEAITGMTGFPVFGDDTGTVIIARKDNFAIIDKMRYNDEMHYPLLVTAEGVSLERTNPDLPSDDSNNWHSAAETSGFATPGYLNSHWKIPEVTDHEIMVQPAIFSPDNDGFDDLLIITLRVKDPDFAVNIMVYDSRGRQIRQIANNVMVGTEGIFIWDGMTAARMKASLGFYVLLIEMTRPDGTVRKIKRTAVLGGKL